MNTEHTNQSRTQFEAWASEHCCAAGGISFKRFSDDGASSIYNDPNVETAWQAWQAASQQQAEPVARDVIAKLVALTRAVNIALDDSEERDGADGREHVIGSVNFDAVCDALEALEELPDNKPGWAMSAADKAEWALRHLSAAQPPAVAVAVPEVWRDAMERAAEDLEDNNCLESAHQLRAMLAAAPQGADPIKRLIAMHNELLGEYPYCYFELAYTRRTDWMAWLCTKPREDDPERKVLACGQGLTAEEACAEAISAAQKGGG